MQYEKYKTTFEISQKIKILTEHPGNTSASDSPFLLGSEFLSGKNATTFESNTDRQAGRQFIYGNQVHLFMSAVYKHATSKRKTKPSAWQ